ncbi:restriction endonuclease subunit S [Verrucomicrobia bacterium]|nr:restriction endonuclease subunit S [Verrucomicrobiota bacterium]
MSPQTAIAPDLRFSSFEQEWETKRLGDLCSTFKSGSGITSSKITDEGVFPVYGGNGLRGYTDSYTHEGFYFLIGRQGALCGNINHVRNKSFISEHAIAVQGNEEADTEWLAQRLDYFNLNRLSESSAQPGLSVGKLARLKITLPTLPEQRKIADFLTAVDGRIGQLIKKKALLEDYKKGVMQQLFTQAIRFKDDHGKDFPDWEEKKLGEVANLYQPKTISQTDLTPKGYTVYGANGIIGKYHSFNHEKPQVTVTCRGSTCGVIGYTEPHSWITGNAMVINLDECPDSTKTFVYHALCLISFKL